LRCTALAACVAMCGHGVAKEAWPHESTQQPVQPHGWLRLKLDHSCVTLGIHARVWVCVCVCHLAQITTLDMMAHGTQMRNSKLLCATPQQATPCALPTPTGQHPPWLRMCCCLCASFVHAVRACALSPELYCVRVGRLRIAGPTHTRTHTKMATQARDQTGALPPTHKPTHLGHHHHKDAHTLLVLCGITIMVTTTTTNDAMPRWRVTPTTHSTTFQPTHNTPPALYVFLLGGRASITYPPPATPVPTRTHLPSLHMAMRSRVTMGAWVGHDKVCDGVRRWRAGG
jgi:hypothetical protein